MYIYIYIYIFIEYNTYIYIYIEREREGERHMYMGQLSLIMGLERRAQVRTSHGPGIRIESLALTCCGRSAN